MPQSTHRFCWNCHRELRDGENTHKYFSHGWLCESCWRVWSRRHTTICPNCSTVYPNSCGLGDEFDCPECDAQANRNSYGTCFICQHSIGLDDIGVIILNTAGLCNTWAHRSCLGYDHLLGYIDGEASCAHLIFSGMYVCWCKECDTYTEGDFINCSYCGAEYGDDSEDDEGNPRSENSLHDYSYEPHYMFLTTENSTDEMFFGVELEIDREESYDFHDLDLLPDWTYAKYDSSIEHGFEIVTHPFTWAWFMINGKDKLFDVMKKLHYRNYISGNSGTCGMHIHMSTIAFTHFHLYKFMYMIYRHPSLILLLSQRIANLLDRWASIKAEKANYLYRAYTKSQGGYNRHDAVNISPKHTIELRIFDGTLNPLTFMKNMDTARALYSFTRDTSITQLTPNAFCDYVKDSHHYPYLALFLSSSKYHRNRLFGADTPRLPDDEPATALKIQRLLDKLFNTVKVSHVLDSD